MEITTNNRLEAEAKALEKRIASRLHGKPLLSKLTREEEAELFSMVRQGGYCARTLIFELTKREALWLAKEHLQGAYEEDIKSEIMDALWCCIGKFRPESGNRFRSYYPTVVENAAKRARKLLPATMATPETAIDEKAAIYNMEQDMLTKPENRMHLELYATSQYYEIPACDLAEATGLGEKRVKLLRMHQPFGESLDCFFDPDGIEREDDASRLADTSLADDALCQQDFADEVSRALAGFSERDRAIFRALYPLSSEAPMSKGELAQAYGMSPQRVGQIEQKMLAHLRNSPEMRFYADKCA